MSLTKRQQEILKRHKKHHTAKHMVFMRKEMENLLQNHINLQ